MCTIGYKKEYLFFKKIATRFHLNVKEIKESSLFVYYDYLYCNYTDMSHESDDRLWSALNNCSENHVLYIHNENEDMNLFFFEILSKEERAYLSMGPMEKKDREIAYEFVMELVDLMWGKEGKIDDYSLVMQKHHPVVTEAMDYIDQDLSKNHSLKTIAKSINVSPGHLSKLFTMDTGMTLTEYINRKKIAYGARLLLHTDEKISTIADQCGISDHNYFSRLFKKYMNTTPAAYRKSGGREV